jgi:hypothetical protein
MAWAAGLASHRNVRKFTVGQVVRPGCMGPDIGRYGGRPGRVERLELAADRLGDAGMRVADRLTTRSTRRERHHAILGGGRRQDLRGDYVGELQRSEVAGAVDGAQADVAEELLQAV